MPYSSQITRANPTCFLFLIDQSGSMQDVMDPTNIQPLEKPIEIDSRSYTHAASGRTKAQFLADVMNRLLQNLSIKCARNEGIWDYFHLGVIGYGAHVGPGFTGPHAGKELVPISEVANMPARIEQRTKKVEDGAGGLVDETIRVPVWIDPVADGGTPMCQALTQAHTVLQRWLPQHPNCYPPVVMNITDGEVTDGDPTGAADNIKKLSSSDGEVLLMNLHLSTLGLAPILFPDTESGLPDQFARLLFRISSTLPSRMRSIANGMDYKLSDGARGFVFNAVPAHVIQFLEIGTSPDLR